MIVFCVLLPSMTCFPISCYIIQPQVPSSKRLATQSEIHLSERSKLIIYEARVSYECLPGSCLRCKSRPFGTKVDGRGWHRHRSRARDPRPNATRTDLRWSYSSTYEIHLCQNGKGTWFNRCARAINCRSHSSMRTYSAEIFFDLSQEIAGGCPGLGYQLHGANRCQPRTSAMLQATLLEQVMGSWCSAKTQEDWDWRMAFLRLA